MSVALPSATNQNQRITITGHKLQATGYEPLSKNPHPDPPQWGGRFAGRGPPCRHHRVSIAMRCEARTVHRADTRVRPYDETKRATGHTPQATSHVPPCHNLHVSRRPEHRIGKQLLRTTIVRAAGTAQRSVVLLKEECHTNGEQRAVLFLRKSFLYYENK